MKRGDWTLIVARFAESPARKYSFSKKLTSVLGIVLSVLLSSFVLSALHYYSMFKRTAEYDRLKVEVDQLRKENETFRLAANYLSDKISALEITSKKLAILSGLDGKGLGGQGGPPARETLLSGLNSQNLARQFDLITRKSGGLEAELTKLQQFYTTRSILLAATPAILPVVGYPSASFGSRADPFSGIQEFHPGIDISAPYGSKVVATADGIAVFTDRRFGYGRLVVVEHKFGISTRYGHLSRAVVKVGQKVKKGDIIGYVGSTGRATGPHLHYEVRLNDEVLNPFLFVRESSS